MLDAGSLTEAAPKIVAAICQNLGWEVGAVWEVDPSSETIHCVGVWRLDESTYGEFDEATRKMVFDKGAALPGSVLESGRPEWITDVAKSPNFLRAEFAAKQGLHGGFAFPIISDGRVLGVIEFFSSQVQEPDQHLLSMMETIGNQIGQLMRRQQIEEELRESESRLEFLARASRILSSSLDFDQVLERVAKLTVPRIADWCAVDLVQEDGLVERVAVEQIDPSKVTVAHELPRKYPPDPNSIYGVHLVMRTGEGELYSEIPEDLIRAVAQNTEHFELIKLAGMQSAMVVPLKARGKIIGAISLAISDSPRRYNDDDLILAQDLADRAALAIDNARLFSESSNIARALQKSFLPPSLPRIKGMELASGYHAVGQSNEVGGDFYDIFRTGSRSWSVVIGDVCGKGLHAAAMTALARYTLRAAAMERRKPSRILKVLNEAILIDSRDSQFCSAVYLGVKVSPEGTVASMASGGHPPPLLLRADGSVEAVGVPGTLLGLYPDPDLTDVKVTLDIGDVLLLYTDGLIEARGTGEIFGEERLMALLESCRGFSAQEVAGRIEKEVLEFQQGKPPRDDIAYVVFRVTG